MEEATTMSQDMLELISVAMSPVIFPAFSYVAIFLILVAIKDHFKHRE
jgi:hypothetical protein